MYVIKYLDDINGENLDFLKTIKSELPELKELSICIN